MKAALTFLIFCATIVPARPQAIVLKNFVTVGEGLTSRGRRIGIVVSYRMFSTPTLPGICGKSGRPSRLSSATGPLRLRVGEWFPLSRLMVVGEDRAGKLLRPLPISVELEAQDPPLVNLNSEMISDGRLLPVRAGHFRFRARTLCAGTTADVYIEVVVRPR